MNISKISNCAYSAVVAVPTAIYNKTRALRSRVSSAVASCFSKIASLFSRSSKPLANVAPVVAGSTTPASSVAHSVLSTPVVTPAVSRAPTPEPVEAFRPISPVAAPAETVEVAIPALSEKEQAVNGLTPARRKLYDGLRGTTRVSLEQRQNDFLKLPKAI